MTNGFGIPGLGMLVVWGLIIYLVVWLFRGVSTPARAHGEGSALDVLDRRLARGEIGGEEHQEKKRALS